MTPDSKAAIATVVCGAASWIIYAFVKRGRCPNEATSDDPLKQGFSMKHVPKDLDAIVIGSGIGGLSTAAILAKEGKKVLVLEQHDIAGGNLHTFTERGYEFDTGLHYVGDKIGDRGRSSMRKLLNYITDGEIEWEPMDDAYDIAISGNERYNFSGWTKQKKFLKECFPDEVVAIDKYFDVVHYTAKFLLPLSLGLRMLPERVFNVCRWLLGRYMGILTKTTKEVLESITSNRKLMGVLSYHYGDYGEPPARGSFLMNALIASHYRAGAYYPIGGPLRISESIVCTIEKWGGKVMVRAPVSSILMNEKDQACGVLVKNKKIFAKVIVSSCGFPITMTKLIPESHRHLVRRQIDAMKNPSIASDISLMSMFVGIDDPEGVLKLPRSNFWVHASWDHDGNMMEHRKDHSKLPALFISFPSAKDPNYASRHPGKQCAVVIGPCRYDDVEQFKDDRVKHRSKEYVAMKEKWQEMFTAVLLQHFPELEKKIDHIDFGTAVTNDFYLGTHRGAVYGLGHTPERMEQYWLRAKTPISNLYMSGQDICCCGVCGALVGGYMCAYAISACSFFHTMTLWA